MALLLLTSCSKTLVTEIQREGLLREAYTLYPDKQGFDYIHRDGVNEFRSSGTYSLGQDSIWFQFLPDDESKTLSPFTKGSIKLTKTGNLLRSIAVEGQILFQGKALDKAQITIRNPIKKSILGSVLTDDQGHFTLSINADEIQLEVAHKSAATFRHDILIPGRYKTKIQLQARLSQQSVTRGDIIRKGPIKAYPRGLFDL